MKLFATVLRLLAPVFFAVAAVHLWLGVGADALLGAKVSAEALADPTLNSQNRFYGVAFALFGVILLICAGDLRKYQTVLRAALWVFLFAGLARLVSIVTHGLPAPLVLLLLATELLAPPALLLWLQQVLAEQ